MARKRTEEESRTLVNAVIAWYRFYEVPPEVDVSSVLCNAAIELGDDGCDDEMIATILIGTYVGLQSARVNAKQRSVH
jgi:hypothetical protein